MTSIVAIVISVFISLIIITLYIVMHVHPDVIMSSLAGEHVYDYVTKKTTTKNM
jgi:hypothetical protein